ncbi:BLUF domain-containing protein [Veronia pacifica]|uniref:BLUF domain protein n=1 Tax=Veronia pacifica TaxID=1080227 RepID=A0A1C3EPT8_9GAMM|nr:BLUF domain-containing protein [Veronia pacifica]ODA35209.1 BLUF domain protein [Veronia pacifica]
MKNDLTQIIYISSAEHPFSDRELDELLEDIRQRNQSTGVTGMLLYRDGDFIQAIEGPNDHLVCLYEKICRDNRHYGVREMSKLAISERAFDATPMAFHHIQDNDPRLSQHQSFFSDDPSVTFDPGEALSLLLAFKK